MKQLLVVLICLTLAGASYSAERTAGKQADVDASGFRFALHLFQKFISPADGERCPMAPTCSTYARTAIHRHGPLIGGMMTCDRLLRCGRDEMRTAATVRSGHRRYSVDMVENNDFWWDAASYLQQEAPANGTGNK